MWKEFFYNSKITLLKESAGEMYHGIYTEGATTQKEIICDVQPSSRQQTLTEYGEYIEAEYRVFCDVDTDIKVGMKVLYNGTEYTIENLTDWETYYILVIKAVGL